LPGHRGELPSGHTLTAQQASRFEIANAKANGRLIRTNADADGELLEQVAAPDAEGRKLLTDAAEKFRLTARGYHRVLRVARTLADLDAAYSVRRPHIAEALSYRRVMLRG
jgi:magnesium chelatase family protein